MAQRFSIFWITPLTKYIIGVIFSSGGATLYKNPTDQTVPEKSTFEIDGIENIKRHRMMENEMKIENLRSFLYF